MATQPLAFGLLLKRYRLAAGLTQEALAERATLSARSISALECGVNQTPRRETVALLLAALQVPEDEAALLEASIVRRRGPHRLLDSFGVLVEQPGVRAERHREAPMPPGAALAPSTFSEIGSSLIATPCGPGAWLLTVAGSQSRHDRHATPAGGYEAHNGHAIQVADNHSPHATPADAPVRRTRLAQIDRYAWVVAYLQTVEAISPREYVAALSINRRTAIRDLQALREGGLLQASGTTKDRRYTLRCTTTTWLPG